jgi:hypothetical protein
LTNKAKPLLFNETMRPLVAVMKLAERMGADLRISGFKVDYDPESISIIRRVRPYTMTNPERLFSLIQATRYVLSAGIPGSIVECGVWRGGSMMAAALTLRQAGDVCRDLYLFDTYEGLPAPTPIDVNYRGLAARRFLTSKRLRQDNSASLYEVKANLASTGYPDELLHFVQGRVEETIPNSAPDQIAILRLDTDWYESTRHELIQLYPRLAAGGVLIIDDYGYWRGARKAVDDYMAEHRLNLLLNRVDSSCRIAVKP